MSNFKIKNIKLANFNQYKEVDVEFDNKVTYLIGKNGAGKSTLGINAVWAIFNGIAEKGSTALIGERWRFIGENAKSAKGEITLVDEQEGVEIKIIRKITASGNELQFEAPEGYNVSQEWLTNIFNVFLVSPKAFTQLSSKQQAVALGIDTEKIDADIKKIRSDKHFVDTRIRELKKGMEEKPEIEEEIKIEELQEKIKTLNDQRRTNSEVKTNAEKLAEKIDNTEYNRIRTINSIETIEKEIKDLQERLVVLNNEKKAFDDLISDVREQFNAILETPAYKDYESEDSRLAQEITTVSQSIMTASEKNTKFRVYNQSKKEIEENEAKAEKLKESLDKKQEERLDIIQSKKLPFDNLSISDEGELLLNNKPIKPPYYSTGELIKIVPMLFSALETELKYVFIQDFNLLDEDKQKEIEAYLTEQGFQLVIEYVGTSKIDGKNCILLKESKIVDSYDENAKKLSI